MLSMGIKKPSALYALSMSHIEANETAVDAMRLTDPTQPIVMLNLLKFRGFALDGFGVDGLTGGQAFRRYGELNEQEDVKFGSEPIWMGPAHNTIIGDEEWDIAILVRYPSRQHFIDKLDNEKYREIAKVRHAALSDSRLIELTQLLPAP
jgi:uncharacterized protein (DUF1330 family)